MPSPGTSLISATILSAHSLNSGVSILLYFLVSHITLSLYILGVSNKVSTAYTVDEFASISSICPYNFEVRANTNKYVITKNGRMIIIFSTVTYQRVMYKTLAMTLSPSGYPFDRTKMVTCLSYCPRLACISRIQQANFSRGLPVRPISWTTWSGVAGRMALSARHVRAKVAGRWLTVATNVQAVVLGRR